MILGDMGGSIGLYLGGSLLTLVEIVDLLLFTYFIKSKPNGPAQSRNKNSGGS